MRADPPCECQKRGMGCNLSPYTYKSLKISVLFATKTEVLRQKCGFFVSVSIFCKLSKIREKAKK